MNGREIAASSLRYSDVEAHPAVSFGRGVLLLDGGGEMVVSTPSLGEEAAEGSDGEEGHRYGSLIELLACTMKGFKDGKEGGVLSFGRAK